MLLQLDVFFVLSLPWMTWKPFSQLSDSVHVYKQCKMYTPKGTLCLYTLFTVIEKKEKKRKKLNSQWIIFSNFSTHSFWLYKYHYISHTHIWESTLLYLFVLKSVLWIHVIIHCNCINEIIHYLQYCFFILIC